jgi:hypothetical protein
MGTRRTVPVLLAALAMAACGEQQQPEGLAGPTLAGRPTNPAACDPKALNSLITGYFQGSASNPIKALKDAMVASPNTPAARDAGFAILDSIGSRSRGVLNGGAAVDISAGSQLTQGVIKCMFDATTFDPTFPGSAIYNFAPALDAVNGGAFYTRGAGRPGTGPVQGVLPVTDGLDVQSGVNPFPDSSWTSALAVGNGGSEGRALIYGYQTSSDPFTYEWATIPTGVTFTPGAIVALCNGDAPSLMVHESNVGVLAFQSADPICAAPYSVVLTETGWGPRALAARLARVVVDALRPTPLQAAALKSGTGGTATTFKSKFSKDPVTTVTLKYTTKPPSVIRLGRTVTAEVRATTLLNGVTTGVNGVCVYLVGSNNNGQNTSLIASADQRCLAVPGTANDYTESKNLQAGFASFSFGVTKTGGLNVTATATDDNGNPIGAVGRNGQTFTTDVVRTNVKP